MQQDRDDYGSHINDHVSGATMIRDI